jgi:hypothetical protein
MQSQSVISRILKRRTGEFRCALAANPSRLTDV